MIDDKQLQGLKLDIKTRGYIDREHVLQFLTLIPTNDAQVIIQAVKDWLKSLNDDPELSQIVVPEQAIIDVLGDLDSYGRVHPSTILEFKQNSSRVPPQIG